MLISPVRMLHNWGSSSRLDLRRKEPGGVRNMAGSASRWVATSGVSMRMVRNFGIRNGTLFLPMRSDQKITGPREVSFTTRATHKRGTAHTHRAHKVKVRSNRRFMQILSGSQTQTG